MKRTITIISAIMASCFAATAGRPVSVEVCSDKIVHVRSYKGEATPTLMERYGIVKTDWSGMSAVKGKAAVGASGYSCELDEAAQTIRFYNADGSMLTSISLVGADNPLCQKLADVINDKFSGMNVASNGGIIGDDDGTISEKDKTESGDPAKSSIVSIAMADGERFYGGGSTSRDHIQHRGELLRMWTTYQHTEIPMPFMLSSRGWGIFNNTTRKNYFDVGYTDKDTFNVYTTCEDIDFYVILGGDMAGVIDGYTELTGRPYVLPKWAYGFGFGPNMREDQWDIMSDAAMFRQVDVPVDFFWLEPQWMEKRYDFSTEKKWNYDKFSPEPYWLQDKFPKKEYPRLFVGKLKSMGIHLGLWLCEEYDLSLVEEDIIAAREGRPTSGQEHWMDHLRTFVDMGVRGFKLDPARTIDEHTYRKYYNGRTDKEMHNLNQVLLPKQMAEMTRDHIGRRTWHHYCGGWSGTQHWGASTSGDNGGGKVALFDQINLGMSGFMNTSCDVMSVEKELEMQSLHFGMFLPWVQVNSWFSMMHPFYFSDEELTIYRDYVKLRYSLMPYIYSMALEGAQTGMPMVRSMPLLFPEDRECDDMCYQYMFGSSFLVGIFTNSVYLPAGEWYDYWSGEKIVSRGETVSRDYPANRAGMLFVRQGSIIPTQHDVMHIGTAPVKDIVLKVYPCGDSSYTMYEDDGDSYEFEKGAIAATRFDCSAGAKETRLTINAVSGSFEGMPQIHNYELEIASDRKPAGVSVDGRNVREWTFAGNRVCLTLSDVDVNATTTVRIKY